MDNLKESLDEEKRVANSFAKTQIEKSYYLGEYKERVLGALNKDQIIHTNPIIAINDNYISIDKNRLA